MRLSQERVPQQSQLSERIFVCTERRKHKLKFYVKVHTASLLSVLHNKVKLFLTEMLNNCNKSSSITGCH